MQPAISGRREMHLGVAGTLSIWHWAIVLVVVILLFGRNRISSVMGDAAKGIRSFKKGLAEEEPPAVAPPAGAAQHHAAASAPADRPPAT
jgi:sec-independent protein translocase protein TatA